MIALTWTTITLTDGTTAKVSPPDYERVSKYRWHTCINGLLAAITRKKHGKIYKANVPLHRFIMNPTRSQRVIFRNGDMRDCRRENLCVASLSAIFRAEVTERGAKGFCVRKPVWERGGIYEYHRGKRKEFSIELWTGSKTRLKTTRRTRQEAEAVLQEWRHRLDDRALCARAVDMYDGRADYAGQWGADFESLSMMSHVYQEGQS